MSAAEEQHGVDRADLLRIALIAAVAAATWFRLWRPLPQVDLLALAAMVVGGWPIWREAAEAVTRRRMTMELSMSIAIFAAAIIGESFTALIIVGFVLIAEILEHLTVGRGRKAIGRLVALLPRTALVRRGGLEEEIDVLSIARDDLVIVRPGSRIPVDGQVVRGSSWVDQSAMTGESMPVSRGPAQEVFAGTINQSGVLEIRVATVGRETAFGRVIEAVERAEQSRAPVEKIADRLAGYLVYFALACAAVTLWITHDARSTISVVIVAGACGIAAGTPLAVLGAIGRAARQGAIVKGGIHLETLARVDTVVFDKTGTVTFGEPRVIEVRPAEGISEGELLSAAASAELRSEHPVARAVLKHAAQLQAPVFPPDSFSSEPGLGVVAVVRGEQVIAGNAAFLSRCGLSGGAASGITIARSGRILGSMRIEDTVRPEAKEAVDALRALGISLVLLSGDSQAIVSQLARELGIEEARGDLLPEAKRLRVEALIAQKRTVAMVGDGINDAPALAQASVGIAMGTGTDVAIESADVVLIGGDLRKLVTTLRVARACRRIILQNFVGTLVVDGLGVAAAAFGFLNPLLAAFIHVGSELAFILNSTRLLPRESAAGQAGRARFGSVRGADRARPRYTGR